jgi:hypothetical protein
MKNHSADRLSTINMMLVVFITVIAWIATVPGLVIVGLSAARPSVLLHADITSLSFFATGLGIILVAAFGSLMFLKQFERISTRWLALFYGLSLMTSCSLGVFMANVDL